MNATRQARAGLLSYHARSQRIYERAKHDDQNDSEVAFEAACLTNIALAAEADAEIKKLEELADFHAQERGFGVAKTFFGVPMDEVIQVILNHKKERNCASAQIEADSDPSDPEQTPDK